MRVLLENTTFPLHKVTGTTGINGYAGIIWGRVLYEELCTVLKMADYAHHKGFVTQKKIHWLRPFSNVDIA